MEIRQVRGHWEAWEDGRFIVSADTLRELEEELAQIFPNRA